MGRDLTINGEYTYDGPNYGAERYNPFIPEDAHLTRVEILAEIQRCLDINTEESLSAVQCFCTILAKHAINPQKVYDLHSTVRELVNDPSQLNLKRAAKLLKYRHWGDYKAQEADDETTIHIEYN